MVIFIQAIPCFAGESGDVLERSLEFGDGFCHFEVNGVLRDVNPLSMVALYSVRPP